jgi:hypothetical protein
MRPRERKDIRWTGFVELQILTESEEKTVFRDDVRERHENQDEKRNEGQ